MATKTVAWNSGSGVITLTYTGQGNGSVSVRSDANDNFEARSQNLNIVTTAGSPEKAVQVLVKQAGKPLGWTTKDFEYTGSVQEVTLPKGRYKLQCWGAQGGTSYGASSAVGSKGGYSEGVITLTETTTLYVFVGGKGSRGSTTSLVNGGWNGGGASVGFTSYNSGGTYGDSYPACGGGATDIATVTSSMGYSNGRTNRSTASLLSRIIVAGGGAGGSYRYTRENTTTVEWQEVGNITLDRQWVASNAQTLHYTYLYPDTCLMVKGETYMIEVPIAEDDGTTYHKMQAFWYDENGTRVAGTNRSWRSGISFVFNPEDNWSYIEIGCYCNTNYEAYDIVVKKQVSTSNTTTSTGKSSASQQGGGTSGKGTYGGSQSSAGSGGAFGLGANQTSTNYRYAAGGGGGGWYGGGTGSSDSSTGYIDYTGGGSGFVNTAANASYRPSGYTGLQLDSGSTTAGNSSHPSVNGSTEVGHSGNGYARITVL